MPSQAFNLMSTRYSQLKWGYDMSKFMTLKIKSFSSGKKGVTMLEYALIAALVAVALIASWQGLEGGIVGTLTTVTTSLK